MSFSGPRLKNDGVIKAWQNGLSARNHRHSLASISDESGRAELYSYDLKIGERTPAQGLSFYDNFLSCEPCQMQDGQPCDHASEGVGVFTVERNEAFLNEQV